MSPYVNLFFDVVMLLVLCFIAMAVWAYDVESQDAAERSGNNTARNFWRYIALMWFLLAHWRLLRCLGEC